MTLRDERSLRRRQICVGLIGVAVAVLLTVTCGVIYLDPFGHRSVTLQLTTSGGLRDDDEVRVAGVKVGVVEGVTLHPDRVDVRLRIDDGVRLGEATSADVRLLTAIGGHYVALHPSGRYSLPHNTIPMDRTSVPYTLTDVIADSGDVVDKVNGVTIAQTLQKVTAVLDGQPDAIRDIIAETRELTTTVGDHRDDLDAAVALSDEYVAGLTTGRAKLVEMLRLIGFVGAKAYQVKAEGVETVRSIGALFAFIGKPVYAFTGTIEPPMQKVFSIFRTLRTQPARIDDLLAELRSIVTRIAQAMGVHTADADVDASSILIDAPSITLRPDMIGSRHDGGLCVPSAERRC